MYTVEKSNRSIGLAITTAMVGVMLAGCAGGSAPQASVSAAEAQQAIASGKHKRAIEHAEAAVLAEPRNAEYRAMLGQAYLDAGRFASASTSFQDAVELGDSSARTALSMSLALTGEGRLNEAQDMLRANQGNIAAADLGLAMALAGDSQGAIQVMSNAIRGGDNTVKMRQNLAYAFALAGRWREARLMAAQDVPADMVGQRMEEWAGQAHPQAYQARLAALLDVPANTIDNGQPVQLALGNNPSIDQLAAHAVDDGTSSYAGDAYGSTELAALDSVEADAAWAPAPPQPVAVAAAADNRYAAIPANQPTNFAEAFVAPAPAAAPRRVAPQQDAGSFIAASTKPAAAAVAPRKAAPTLAVASGPVPASGNGSHLVQLGSFASAQGAERAKAIYLRRFPELDGSQMVVTEAVVRGKRYWRVSAAGYNRAESTSMCARVKSSSSDGCITWAEGSPLPGAVDSGVRMARR